MLSVVGLFVVSVGCQSGGRARPSGCICLTARACPVLTSPAHAGMESAAERKARLKALRAARDDKVGGEKKLKFRNYLPRSEELARPSSRRRCPSSRRRRRPSPRTTETRRRRRAGAERVRRGSVAFKRTTEGALNVVPRDPNWDLKRDLEPRAEVAGSGRRRRSSSILRERLKARS